MSTTTISRRSINQMVNAYVASHSTYGNYNNICTQFTTLISRDQNGRLRRLSKLKSAYEWVVSRKKVACFRIGVEFGRDRLQLKLNGGKLRA